MAWGVGGLGAGTYMHKKKYICIDLYIYIYICISQIAARTHSAKDGQLAAFPSEEKPPTPLLKV